jgi:adenylate cyclase
MMGAICAKCGTEPRDGARFCDACGSTIAPSAQDAEFKQVTVLFADVVRSMDIASALGTERLREVMSELLSRSRSVVTRYGGSVDFTGDGIMAIFGAPIALEDHAFRGCLAALGLQEQAQRFAEELVRRDGIELRLRVGLNSGEVIAGEMGSTPGSYTAIGSHVGMAQRMESVAPPGGVMLSASTARLVEDVVGMGEPETVYIKNVDEPVTARRLVCVAERTTGIRGRTTLVGRDRELTTIRNLLNHAMDSGGGVVAVVGPPGIGKSRLVSELVHIGAKLNVDVVSAFCEAHAREIPFYAAARMFRDVIEIGELRGQAARDRLRVQLPGADHEDLLLLDDLLAIGDPEAKPLLIGPDARRRRLSALLAKASAARAVPAMYVIEDAHWIDEASESLIAEFLLDRRGSRALTLVTYRPEYRGKLAQQAVQTVILTPLDGSQSTTLIGELLGDDASVTAIGSEIAERAGGNPFFAEEMVRDLAERGVLQGGFGAYVRRDGDAVIHVPATLQATIAARIDRLTGDAKRTLNAAAVIGARFAEDQVACLVDPVCVTELMDAELIDGMPPTPHVEFKFRHPLIRSVAYESQLHSARAELHSRLATWFQYQGAGTLDEKSAVIAMHVEAAGDLRAAFEWHMRAGTWVGLRNMEAARTSWQRARQVAERLPEDYPDRLGMCVDATTLLCGSAWLAGLRAAETGFDDLRRLCADIRDERSIAVGMSGMVMALAFHNRATEASALGSELCELLERIGDDELSSEISFTVQAAKWETGEVVELLRLSQSLIDLTDGDPAKGNLFFGSPLSLSLAMRGVSRMCLGRSGWKDDLDRAIATARSLDPLTRIIASLHKYAQIGLGALRADDQALRDTAASLAIAEHSGDDFTLSHAHLARGIALVAQDGPGREAGWEHLRYARQAGMTGRGNASIVQIADIHLARRDIASGDLEAAIMRSSDVIDILFDSGAMLWRGPATSVLVETLITRNAAGDVDAAHNAIERLAAVPTDPGFVLHDIALLRLRALVARVEGDEDAYRRLTAGYRAIAESCELEGHTDLAASMT